MSLTFSGTGTKFLPEPKLMAFKPGDKAAFQVRDGRIDQHQIDVHSCRLFSGQPGTFLFTNASTSSALAFGCSLLYATQLVRRAPRLPGRSAPNTIH